MIYENEQYPDLPEGAVFVGRDIAGRAGITEPFEGWALNVEGYRSWAKDNSWGGDSLNCIYAVPATSPLALHAVPSGRNQLHIPLSEWPEWANWAAMDADRTVLMAAEKPLNDKSPFYRHHWWSMFQRHRGVKTAHITDWRETLTPRPVVGHPVAVQPEPAELDETQEARDTIARLEKQLDHQKRLAAEWEQVSCTWREISEKWEEMYDDLMGGCDGY